MKLKEKFLLSAYKDRLYNQLVTLELVRMLVQEYMEEFHELTIRYGLHEGDKLSQFQLGL